MIDGRGPRAGPAARSRAPVIALRCVDGSVRAPLLSRARIHLGRGMIPTTNWTGSAPAQVVMPWTPDRTTPGHTYTHGPATVCFVDQRHLRSQCVFGASPCCPVHAHRVGARRPGTAALGARGDTAPPLITSQPTAAGFLLVGDGENRVTDADAHQFPTTENDKSGVSAPSPG